MSQSHYPVKILTLIYQLIKNFGIPEPTFQATAQINLVSHHTGCDVTKKAANLD